MSGAYNVVAANFLNEPRDVDAGRACRRAGRIEAKVAAVRLNQCLRAPERRVHITKIPGDFLVGETTGTHRGVVVFRHVLPFEGRLV